MQYVRQNRIVRPRDVESIGIPREHLLRLQRQGKLMRSGRAIYTLPDAAITERHTLCGGGQARIGSRPCLLSALAFHQVTTQNPASVWIALRKGACKPAVTSPSLKVVRLTEPSLIAGSRSTRSRVLRFVSTHPQNCADCFKFRNKIGIDIAIEALKDCFRQKKATVGDIYRYANICRVSKIIRPYMEAL